MSLIEVRGGDEDFYGPGWTGKCWCLQACSELVTEYSVTMCFHSSKPLPVLPNDRATLTGSPLNLPPGPLMLVHPLTSTFRVHNTEILRTERGPR